MAEIIWLRRFDESDPEFVPTVRKALDRAWDELTEFGHPATDLHRQIETRELMTKRILSMTAEGMRDPLRLAGEAIAVVLASTFPLISATTKH
jgi:hypothetical protein